MKKKLHFTPSLTKDEFKKLAEDYSIIPIFGESIMDLETPVSTFLKLKYDSKPFSFLLESVVNGEIRGRYSFLGADPFRIIEVSSSNYKTYRPKKNDKIKSLKNGKTSDPLKLLRQEINKLGNPYHDKRLPSFFGGAVGYLGYDLIRYYEKLPDKNQDNLEIPDLFFMFTNEIVLFDHIDNKIKVVVNIFFRKKNKKYLSRLYNKALKLIEKIFKQIIYNTLPPPGSPEDSLETKKEITINSLYSKNEFMEKVDRAKEYIKEGDIFQVVLSNRFSFQSRNRPLTLYRALRCINPSPYLFYYKFNSHNIIGSSPELMVKKSGELVEIRPIAGTRPRGKELEADKKFEEDLLGDEKEIAEHIMLVDLARNDLGRISKRGTVKVARFKFIERYSHVMHIVSSCTGILVDDMDATGAMQVSLPAGTLSGAPKIRAMEIIDELENIRRSFYGGTIGYISYNGDMDTAIMIRTIYTKGSKGIFQVGGGIVFDSVPENEYQEVLNKAQAMKQAIRLAEKGLKL